MKPKMIITDSHSSITDASRDIIKNAEKLGVISKIGIGIIKVTKSKGGKRSIKFLPITGGIKASVRGSGTVQELFIYTKEMELVKKYLSYAFE
jgi:phosphoglycerate dehydrogenase-like enzyme